MLPAVGNSQLDNGLGNDSVHEPQRAALGRIVVAEGLGLTLLSGLNHDGRDLSCRSKFIVGGFSSMA